MRRDLTSILIPFVYFIAGATTLAGVASTFAFKDDLHLTIPQVQILGSLGIIPWSIKPLYGLLSDRLPLRGLRRKPYLFLAGILGAAGYFSLATWVHSFGGAAAALLISAAGFALADVIVDGIVAERSRTQKEAGKLQSVCRASLLIGALIVSYASGILVTWIGARNVFLVTGFLPLLTSLFAICMTESPLEVKAFAFRETW
ncbi:MFS transporter, partial [Candidatus Peregrinibacteria bacterium]|nr:MFS transporter [Candidatus Peregrinibacteria bacterium]